MRDKVQEIFRELVGEKADRLRSDRYLADVNSIITTALAADNPEWSDDDLVEKDGIGKNLIDWQSDAAFIVALSLYPERFSQEEVQEGSSAHSRRPQRQVGFFGSASGLS